MGERRQELDDGSIDRKLMIRMGRVTKISGVREPALRVTRMEYSTSKRWPLVTLRAVGFETKSKKVIQQPE